MTDDMRQRQQTTFLHSTKVPKLYKEAAKALQRVEEHKDGLKSAIHSVKHPNVKALTALVSKAIQQRPLMDVILTKSKLETKEPRLALYLAKILITELLWGSKSLGGNSKPVQTVMTYKEKFEKILERYYRQNKASGISSSVDALAAGDNLRVRKPRYVRVNSLTKSLDEVLNFLELEGWKQIPHKKPEDLEIYDFFVDPFVENLLVFRPGTEFHHHPLYLDGTFILQDKASCLAALALKPRRGKVVLDACAAPGMKTSHLAALMQNEGKIFAVEKNTRRCETLSSMIESMNVTCVTVMNQDFTDIDPSLHPEVEYILVDPSCSGSGMSNRVNEVQPQATQGWENGQEGGHSGSEYDRLKKLSFYQTKVLLHAMKFPNVKKIVYSTCSLHSEENEDVVASALGQNTEFRVKTVLKDWFHRLENSNYEWANCCIKCDFENDQTDGFFVALLEKVKVKVEWS